MGSNNSSSTKIDRDFQSPTRSERVADTEKIVHQVRQEKFVHYDPQVKSVDQDLQTGYVHRDPQAQYVDQDLQTRYFHRDPQVRSIDQNPQAQYVDQDLQTRYFHRDPQVRSIDQNLQTRYVHRDPQAQYVNQDLQTRYVHRDPQVRSVDEDLQSKYFRHDPEVRSVDEDLQTRYFHRDSEVSSADEDLQAKYSHHDPEMKSIDEDPQTKYVHRGTQVKSADQDLQAKYVHRGTQVKPVDQDIQTKYLRPGAQVQSVDQDLQTKPVHQNSRIKLVHQNFRIKTVHQDSQVQTVDEKPDGKTGQFDLNQMTLPSHLSHAKAGYTLCSNGNIMLIQDGSTTIEFRLLPNLEPKKLPWRFGLVRDIIWCSDLDVFLLLTKDALYSISPKSLLIPAKATNKPIPDFTINTYKKAKPYDVNASFWRFTCVGTTLYISYAGHGTVIDEYSLKVSSCKFVNHWTPPKTCAEYEDIWCIRYHPDTDQLGFTIMNTRNDQWRIEVHSRDKLTLLWQLVLPITSGDWEISPLSNGDWLAINACGLRLVQITNKRLTAAIDYGRELRNAIVINNIYFVVRTKTTIEFHQIKRSK